MGSARRPARPAAAVSTGGRFPHADIPADSPGSSLVVRYQPILDVVHGTAGGYQAQVSDGSAGQVDVARPWPLSHDRDGSLTAAAARTALAAVATLPVNTFLTVPIPVSMLAVPAVQAALLTTRAHEPRPLGGVVLDLVGPVDAGNRDHLMAAVAPLREAGALIGVGGYGAPQPELSSILGLRPSILRLGRDWVRGIDTTPSKRSALETIGSMADQLNAWILVEGVDSAAQLEVLTDLSVPLAQGPFIGDAQTVWPGIAEPAKAAVPAVPTAADGSGGLRPLVQPARTATDAAAVTAVLPGSAGGGVVVVVGADGRPTTVIEQDGADRWGAWDALTVNVETPVNDVVLRALTRPRSSRFAPIVCTDDLGHLLGVLRMERLVSHLARGEGAGSEPR